MDVIADSDSDVAEVVTVKRRLAVALATAFTSGDGEDEVSEVNLPQGGLPLSFHGYRRGRELGQGGSSQAFVCSPGLRAPRNARF